MGVCFLAARTKEVMQEFGQIYKQQYAVALFNSVRHEIEGGGGPQSQLLHRKAGLIVVLLQTKVTLSPNLPLILSFFCLDFTKQMLLIQKFE